MKTTLNTLIAALCIPCLTSPVAAAAADVTGKWNFVLDTQDGERRTAAEFRLDGETVSGKWGETDAKGTYADGKLELSFPLNSEAGLGTLKISGKVEGKQITGTWQFESYSGTFQAARAE
jgi:hypothetical protein